MPATTSTTDQGQTSTRTRLMMRDKAKIGSRWIHKRGGFIIEVTQIHRKDALVEVRFVRPESQIDLVHARGTASFAQLRSDWKLVDD